MEGVRNNFLTQVLDGPTRSDTQLNLLFTNKELVEDVIISSSLGCSDHAIVELKILRGVRKESSRVQTLDFRRADVVLFRELVGRIP